MKKVIAFDLDGTLAPSKSSLPDEMSLQLERLLDRYEVCVMSGGRFEQFELQLLGNLKVHEHLLARLHLMPTCGTRYYRYDDLENSWKLLYAEDIPEKDKKKIIEALNEGLDTLGLREKKVYGEVIEDRKSQITLSALGQDIVAHLGEKGVEMKERWDPEGKKRHALRDFVAAKIPDYEVRVGGGTSIDITRPGIDKAYGIQKLKIELGIGDDDIVFIGDRLEEGGNDYPVRALGVDCVSVQNWQETVKVIEGILSVS